MAPPLTASLFAPSRHQSNAFSTGTTPTLALSRVLPKLPTHFDHVPCPLVSPPSPPPPAVVCGAPMRWPLPMFVPRMANPSLHRSPESLPLPLLSLRTARSLLWRSASTLAPPPTHLVLPLTRRLRPPHLAPFSPPWLQLFLPLTQHLRLGLPLTRFFPTPYLAPISPPWVRRHKLPLLCLQRRPQRRPTLCLILTCNPCRLPSSLFHCPALAPLPMSLSRQSTTPCSNDDAYIPYLLARGYSSSPEPDTLPLPPSNVPHMVFDEATPSLELVPSTAPVLGSVAHQPSWTDASSPPTLDDPDPSSEAAPSPTVSPVYAIPATSVSNDASDPFADEDVRVYLGDVVDPDAPTVPPTAFDVHTEQRLHEPICRLPRAIRPADSPDTDTYSAADPSSHRFVARLNWSKLLEALQLVPFRPGEGFAYPRGDPSVRRLLSSVSTLRSNAFSFSAQHVLFQWCHVHHTYGRVPCLRLPARLLTSAAISLLCV